jgi:hypothetical protein
VIDLKFDTSLRFYILDGHTPVQVRDELAWARWNQTHPSHVAQHTSSDGWWVSTKFMGYDMRLLPRAGEPPLVFETMAFQPDAGIVARIVAQDRYETWDAAAEGHARIVADLQRSGIALHQIDQGGSTA